MKVFLILDESLKSEIMRHIMISLEQSTSMKTLETSCVSFGKWRVPRQVMIEWSI